MFLGFATLMMAPLRVEYLANRRYGVRVHGDVLTAGTVALITGVIPNVRVSFKSDLGMALRSE